MADTISVPSPLKSGFKSSEFWILFLVTVFGGLQSAGLLGHGDTSAIIGSVLAGFSAVGYGAQRAYVKAAHAKTGGSLGAVPAPVAVAAKPAEKVEEKKEEAPAAPTESA